MCAVLSSVCATTVDNSGVYLYYLKGIVSVCFSLSDARLGLWASLEHAFICASTTNQAERRSSVAHLLARWEHERTTAHGGHVHKPYSRHPLQAQAPLNLSVM